MLTPPPQEAFIERIRSRIAEGRRLSIYDYESICIPLCVRLTSSRTRGTAQYLLPNDKRFRLQGILPICNIVTMSDESITNAGTFPYNAGGPTTVFTGGDLFDRQWAKAHNCSIDVKFDSQNGQINYNASWRLSDLFDASVDGLNFGDTPTTFPPDTSFDLFASLADSAASGSSTEYGVVLYGQLIRI